MILACPGCSARYRLDDGKMAGGSPVVRCKKCGASLEVVPPSHPSLPGPAAQRNEKSNPAGPSASGTPGRMGTGGTRAVRTALLADEEREFREFVRSELQAAGYEVSLTENGEEALLLAGSHSFDLIILNAYLRRLLGIHVCERIKANPALRQTPVILMGALLAPEAAGSGSRSRYGADDFISTSISREDLAARLQRCSRGSAAPAAGSIEPPRREEAPAPAAGSRPAPGGKAPPGDETEIRRLARIMISDIEIYHPEKFNRALRDGTFFEAFSDELAHGKEMIDRRFGHLPNRIQILAAGLRDSLEVYRGGGSGRQASSG